ncbi:terminase small subunit [Mucilaginibacter sp. UYCu711]|uniref:terminase small subunit n=1 Tax=Mucilaginibacter sp. UYCu711 TaxID=3156339 RepID=UPI003D21CF04
MPRFPVFHQKATLINLIEDYFTKALTDDKSKSKHHQPPTITGLAFHLGFKSKEQFDDFEKRARLRSIITQARFRIMAYYESRLHYPSPAGAIFALKSMGWTDKPKAVTKRPRRIKSIKVNLVETGPQPASSEKEVQL